MWRRLQNGLNNDTQSGLYIDDSLVSFARVQRNNGGMLHLAAQATDKQEDEDAWRQAAATP